jgi:hypothetical protein
VRYFLKSLGCSCAIVLALMCGAASSEDLTPKTSVTTDVSDLWWNPAESGWGLQLVQEHDFAFATIFVYGSDGRPTWFSGQLTVGSGTVFSGPLYVTSGPYFAGAFNPLNVGVRAVGNMTFSLTSVSTAQLQYTVDGLTVTKQIQRQTLRADSYNGSYFIALNLTQSGCFNPANNGVFSGALGITVSQTPTTMSMAWVFATNDVCTYSGSYSQAGKFGRFSGPFSCTSGETGSMTFFEMTNRIGMLSGRLQGTSNTVGCSYTGRFTGINPSIP